MAKPSPTLYSISKTFIWFAVASMLLTACLVAIVIMDHSREWKGWQKKFAQLKLEKTRKALKDAESGVDAKELEELRVSLKDAEAEFDSHKKNYEAAVREANHIDTELVQARSRAQNLKQYRDSYNYYFEEYRLHGDERAEEYEAKLEEIKPRLQAANLAVEQFEKQKEEQDARVGQYLEKKESLQKTIDRKLEKKHRLEKLVEKLKPSLTKEVLNAPMVDFMAPTLKVQQVVLDNLYDDYHFAKTQKVDRCMTCHLGIDQPGFEDAPQPFRTHPDLDLYLGGNSPHPVEKFGCTVCHGGSGHSVSFTNAAHTPQNETQAAEWKKKYNWHYLHKWDAKMLPLNHVEAACAKCHTQTVEVPRAEKLNRGRKIAETSGCFNCHKIEGFENRWKAGPSLLNVKSKLDHDWIVRWLQNPRDFRDKAQMPRIFHLPNIDSPEDRAKSYAAIESIAAYLLKNSGEVELTAPPVAGSPERGEQLVREIGCTGCHTVAGVEANDFGPELSGLGSKVGPDWLYTWLKNPKHYAPGTQMPSLRLSDQEASDITSYLLTLKNEAFEQEALPDVNPEVLDGLILTHLESKLRHSEAEAQLAGMSREEKMEFLGRKSIAHHGCFSCHDIKGFEDTKPIGTELSHEGSKNIHQFDFGLQEMEPLRHVWLTEKFKNTRIFDEGKEKGYYEKLRMPQFNFSEEEIDALVTFILSLTNEPIPMEMRKNLDLKELHIEAGRLLVSKFNCNGCHSLDGKTGRLWEAAEDKGTAPPILEGEGAKVQEKWLHEFLRNPSTIRPWLKYRMPTFGFTEDELLALVHYFAYLSGEEVTYQGTQIPATTPEKIATGKDLFEKFQCAKCHEANPEIAALGASFLAPDIGLTKQRLKPEWVEKWIYDPQAMQEGTMMPGFFPDGQSPLPDVMGGDARAQIEAIRDYLYVYQSPEKEKKEAS